MADDVPAHRRLDAVMGAWADHGGFIMPRDKDGWPDYGPRIRGPLAAWRAANPGAVIANVLDRWDLTDADFVHLRGVKALHMCSCGQITDAAFAHLAGIHTLRMSGCDQATITDAAFVHLAGIHTLDMSYCNQFTITDAAFVHLRGIHTLDMISCDQATITDAAFVHLRGIHTLNVCECDPSLCSPTLACSPSLQKSCPSTYRTYFDFILLFF
jgi:hypothetical protein